MIGPLYMNGAFGHGTSYVIALIIGICFGFVLERSGFGDARNLTSIFYFRDFRVLRVMFTGIVTAMLGLVLLSWVGLFDYQMVLKYSLLKTYLWPQLAGGLLNGLGFIIGGYCPGTSAVATASGKIDGAFGLLGMVFGTWVFAWGYPLWGAFYKSADMGRVTLWQFFGIPMGLMAVIILAMALVAFYLAGLGEKWAPYDRKVS
jgi:MFS family permease